MANTEYKLLEQQYGNYFAHERRVGQFLRSKNINPDLDISEFSNVGVYSKVKTVQTYDFVSASDHKRFTKFCRMWLKNKGQLNKNQLTKIENSVKYYTNVKNNAQLRERRLANKQKKPV